MLVAISGTSGSGKTTLSSHLRQHNAAQLLPSWTTRPRRASELLQSDYLHVSMTDFDSMDQRGEFALVTTYAGSKYGTRQDDLVAAGSSSTLTIADLTAASVAELRTLSITPVFLTFLHVDQQTAEGRMRSRGDTQDKIDPRKTEFATDLRSALDILASGQQCLVVNAARPTPEVASAILYAIGLIAMPEDCQD